jgi:purine nucleoside phosphorylase
MIPDKPSQIPFRQTFFGGQFQVLKAAFSDCDCRRWKRHMSENTERNERRHEWKQGTKSVLARTQQQQVARCGDSGDIQFP